MPNAAAVVWQEDPIFAPAEQAGIEQLQSLIEKALK